MEASLLPSEEMKALCRNVPVVALRRQDAAAKALEKEFEIPPYGKSWVLSLDGKGELLGSWMGDSAGQGCTRESADRFPAQFVAKIEESLRRTETLKMLERRQAANPADLAAFDALSARLKEMRAHGKQVALYERARNNPDFPAERREDLRVEAFLLNQRAIAQTPEQQRQIEEEWEQILVSCTAHPKIPRVGAWLFSTYSTSFDYPTRSAALLARLESKATVSSDPDAFRELIQTLSERRERTIAQYKAAAKS